MKIKVGDKVRVIAGSEKGKEGKVIKTLSKENRVVVEGVKLVKRHVKPNGQNETGGIQEKEAPIHVSNVKLLDAVKKEKKIPICIHMAHSPCCTTENNATLQSS